ncbi:MAG: UvrD-helicase domain-containing protein [Gammaproteobacteria bacterium]|nr:UvrD-helicase domain-containing protein [Gammaproteobacteria bacterium]
MTSLINATQPQINANIFASAGSGKTYLLITRICRLLLAGAEPQHILAITFTRKGAAEMRQRLHSTLQNWAEWDEERLKTALISINEPADKAQIALARDLYERVLFADQNIRISTFHAFCEDIVHAFPLESELATGFELCEEVTALQTLAFSRLLRLSEQANEKKLSEEITCLAQWCTSYSTLGDVLKLFLNKQNEWRSFIDGHQLEHALHCLDQQHKPLEPFSSEAELIRAAQQIAEVFRHGNTSQQGLVVDIDLFITADLTLDQRLLKLLNVFYTLSSNHEKERSHKLSKTLIKKVGEDISDQCLNDLVLLKINLDLAIESHQRRIYRRASAAWFYCGKRLIEIFQNLKQEQGVVDFSDLEWETFRLLRDQGQALWVQYKLGMRIRHYLVDEFQDTNPIQWQFLQPLLLSSKELVSESLAPASLFLVGDVKQSIYGFRGANSSIQQYANEWSQQEYGSQHFNNDHSWRSSAIIIDAVNEIFSRLGPRFPAFSQHQCEHSERWGMLEIHPLIEQKKAPKKVQAETAISFRNPLSEAKTEIEESVYLEEGRLIAARIQSLINEETPVFDGDHYRPARYSDVLILLRNRSRLDELKSGMNEFGIPFLADSKSKLADYLEIKDLLALLQVLKNPLHDIAFGHVLKSPIFNIKDSQLLQLATFEATAWVHKLAAYHASNATNQADSLLQAYETLLQWQALADCIPVHDLLNRIFEQQELLTRYRQTVPTEDAEQVIARLQQFLSISLEANSGRYPSIQSFLRYFEETQPIAELNAQTQDCVNIMTIHSAKGLESAIVFLANTGPRKSVSDHYSVLCDWPVESDRPSHFLLAGPKKKRTACITELKKSSQLKQAEELNLLYVAITRSCQVLIVSGCITADKKGESWHSLMQTALLTKDDDPQLVWKKESDIRPELSIATTHSATASVSTDPKLDEVITQKLTPKLSQQTATVEPIGNETARLRGIALHQCLEWMSQAASLSAADCLLRLKTCYGEQSLDHTAIISEALNCIQDPTSIAIFQLKPTQQAFNELSIASAHHQRQALFVIDRLIVESNEIHIIDYKTEALEDQQAAQAEAQKHLLQLQDYALALTPIYPQRRIRGSILFTQGPFLVELALNT